MTPSKLTPSWKATSTTIIHNILDDPDHPLQIALRTYSLCLSLALSPVLPQAVLALAVRPNSFPTRVRVLWRALARELRPTGFAWALTIAVSGGVALQRLGHFAERRPDHRWPWTHYVNLKLSLYQKTFLANAISSTLAVALLRWKRHGRRVTVSPTLDLSLLLFVRALDALVQAFLLGRARQIAARQIPTPSLDGVTSEISLAPPHTGVLDKQSKDFAKKWTNKVSVHLDTFVFWASSARIMWCFFYQSQRLPPSFANWINSLASVDKRLLEVLRSLREGSWSYIRGSNRDITASLAEELGRPPSWGDPFILPAYGASFANKVWKQLGIVDRNGVGGMPCELVHGGVGAALGLQNSCTANAVIRAIHAFAQAFVLHLPVYFLPILLTKPSSILRPHRAMSAFLSTARSATFLSAFVSSCWFMVCFARTLVLARLFPEISHDIWDGPYGGTLAGSLVCGTSIWIENAKRRREVALYVLPKALRASISERWLRSRHPIVRFVEHLTLVLSLASLLTFSVHQPEALRGLSKWMMAFVMKGNFWKKYRREIATYPPTDSSVPSSTDLNHHRNRYPLTKKIF